MTTARTTRDDDLDRELAKAGIIEGDYDDEPEIEISLLAGPDHEHEEDDDGP
jgi:hypothetical protein